MPPGPRRGSDTAWSCVPPWPRSHHSGYRWSTPLATHRFGGREGCLHLLSEPAFFYLDRTAMAKPCWPPAFCPRPASLLCFCREYRLRLDPARRYRSVARMTAAALVSLVGRHLRAVLVAEGDLHGVTRLQFGIPACVNPLLAFLALSDDGNLRLVAGSSLEL